MPPACQKAALFQRRDQPVDSRLRLQPERVLHLLEARREAGLLEVAIDVEKQLVLLFGQHRLRFFPLFGTNGQLSRCSTEVHRHSSRYPEPEPKKPALEAE